MNYKVRFYVLVALIVFDCIRSFISCVVKVYRMQKMEDYTDQDKKKAVVEDYAAEVAPSFDYYIYENCPYTDQNECELWTCPYRMFDSLTCKCKKIQEEPNK